MIELNWTMNGSDVNQVGVELGFDWNTICNEVCDEELYGQDGCGYISVSRGCSFNSKMLTAIFAEIFNRYPEMNSVMIMNDD